MLGLSLKHCASYKRHIDLTVWNFILKLYFDIEHHTIFLMLGNENINLQKKKRSKSQLFEVYTLLFLLFLHNLEFETFDVIL